MKNAEISVRQLVLNEVRCSPVVESKEVFEMIQPFKHPPFLENGDRNFSLFDLIKIRGEVILRVEALPSLTMKIGN